MANTFHSQVSAWAKKSEHRLEAVARTATLDIAEHIQKPVAKGGNMRVDTSFLRNSMGAALNSIPTGVSVQPNDYKNTDFDFTETAIVINRAKIGDRITLGWVANYAKYREHKDGFVRKAMQNWNKIVKEASRKVEQRVKS